MDSVSYNDFEEAVFIGQEINFYCQGDEYWISNTKDEKGKIYILTKVVPNGEPESQIFRSKEDLLNRANINYKSLRSIFKHIEVISW